jgi:hypothetical protein
MVKRLDNIQFVSKIMNDLGTQSQAFVISAITKLSEKVAAAPVSDHPDGQTWKAIAEEIQRRINERFG